MLIENDRLVLLRLFKEQQTEKRSYKLRLACWVFFNGFSAKNGVGRVSASESIGFFDAGSAWQGAKLFSIDNPLNQVVLPANNPSSPVIVKVNYFRDPIVMGTGFGLRTTLFGYFIKYDRAWGIETRAFQAPVHHFSIGLDF